MKILIVTPYFYPRIGGLENYVYNLCKILISRWNNKVILICSNWEKKGYKEEEIEGLKVYRLPYLFKISSTPINPFWYKKLDFIIENEKPDIINGHFPVPFITDIASRIANKHGIPFVLTYHNDLIGINLFFELLSRYYYFFLGKRILNLSSRIIATSQYYAQSSKYLKKYKYKLEIANCGVNIIEKNYKLIPYKFVLFVGQLNKASRHKGLVYLMEAIRKVIIIHDDLKLVIVGGGDYIDYYKKKAKCLNIEEKVIFTGFVDDDDLASYYNNCYMLVLPSYNRSEGFGMVLIEAQSFKKPVIGTNIGGIPFAIKDGETGILVKPKDSDELANAILTLIENENLARKYGLKGYQRVLDEFTWEKTAEKTMEIFSELKGK